MLHRDLGKLNLLANAAENLATIPTVSGIRVQDCQPLQCSKTRDYSGVARRVEAKEAKEAKEAQLHNRTPNTPWGPLPPYRIIYPNHFNQFLSPVTLKAHPDSSFLVACTFRRGLAALAN